MYWRLWLIYTRHDCSEWRTEKLHKFANMGKVKDSNYDRNCTSRHCLSGTYKISGRLIFVEQSVLKAK